MLVPRETSAYESYKSVRGGTYLADGVNYDANNLENAMNGQKASLTKEIICCQLLQMVKIFKNLGFIQIYPI